MKLQKNNEDDKIDCNNYTNENEWNENQITEEKLPSFNEDYLNTTQATMIIRSPVYQN